jgi:NAD(P)-dependent dehydrogenase (short-subunit alcohol dehydrogenase family)
MPWLQILNCWQLLLHHTPRCVYFPSRPLVYCLLPDRPNPNTARSTKDETDHVVCSGKINLLALNAGIGPQSEWTDLASFHTIFDTNFFGVVNGINALLPVAKDSASAASPSAIIITGSKQGITNPPGNVAYNASKSAVKTMAEYLSYDLRHHANLSVHLLVPGWTFTGLTSKSTKEKPDGAWWPEQVVDYLETKMGEGQFYVLCPDNDVTEGLDRKRMMWTAGDAVEGRPPMSRWREDWKDRAKEGIEGSH